MGLEQVRLIDPQTGEPMLINVVRGGVQGSRERPIDRQRPPWLKAQFPQGPEFERLKGLSQSGRVLGPRYPNRDVAGRGLHPGLQVLRSFHRQS